MSQKRIELNAGTIETVVVEVEDVLETLGDLEAAGAEFVVKDSAGAEKQAATAVTTEPGEPLQARCVVDTSTGGVWEAGKYYLYLMFTNAPDAPILGPQELLVN
jgi:hypothetical protein